MPILVAIPARSATCTTVNFQPLQASLMFYPICPNDVLNFGKTIYFFIQND